MEVLQTKARTGLQKQRARFELELKKKQKKHEKRRRGWAPRRLAQRSAREARNRQKGALVAVATSNVRTLAVKGNNGYGRDEHVREKGQQLGCGFLDLQETRRSGSKTFRAAGYQVFCPGRDKTAARQGLYGVGLGVKSSIYRKYVYDHQFIDERLMPMRFKMTGKMQSS